jgi:hypothetical protein
MDFALPRCPIWARVDIVTGGGGADDAVNIATAWSGEVTVVVSQRRGSREAGQLPIGPICVEDSVRLEQELPLFIL